MYQFTKTIAVDVPGSDRPVLFQAGARIRADEILPGCLESLLRLRALVETPAATDPAEAFAAAMEAGHVAPAADIVVGPEIPAAEPAPALTVGPPASPEPKPEPPKGGKPKK